VEFAVRTCTSSKETCHPFSRESFRGATWIGKENEKPPLLHKLRIPGVQNRNRETGRLPSCRLESNSDFAWPGPFAPEPEVLLLDESCSALDAVATRKIEEPHEGTEKSLHYCHRHKLAQAKRVADRTGFWYVDTSAGSGTGYVVEFGETRQIFDDPQQKETHHYIKGDFS
jgi:hypothetical protein